MTFIDRCPSLRVLIVYNRVLSIIIITSIKCENTLLVVHHDDSSRDTRVDLRAETHNVNTPPCLHSMCYLWLPLSYKSCPDYIQRVTGKCSHTSSHCPHTKVGHCSTVILESCIITQRVTD